MINNRDSSRLKIQTHRETKTIHRFGHHAMATEYGIIIRYRDKKYAEQAAFAAFMLLDRLERDLSRFNENSEISKINNLGVGRSLSVGPDTMACLQAAQEIWKITGGAFDPGAGNLITAFKTTGQSIGEKNHGGSLLGIHLDPAKNMVRKVDPGVNIDLGAIGKGFVLDRMAELLSEWSLSDFLIHSGYSTVITAQGSARKHVWKVSISDPDRHKVWKVIEMRNDVLSASGLKKGPHIIDPRSRDRISVRRSSWVSAENGAKADALSTAFIVLSVKEIKQICMTSPAVKACILVDGKFINFGL